MSQVQTIKEATDIIEIIGDRITLQRSGTNWRALCPFHSEKSPSFFVSEQMQRYRCFGCSEAGDVYTFLEKYEGMSFAEALSFLADRAGIDLEERVFTDKDREQQRLIALLDLAKEYYHYLLTEHQVGEAARAYLKERGVTAESIKVFQLGFSLPGWDGALKYLVDKKGYTERELELVGLVIKNKSGRYYDRFRGRIMFPLNNHRGQVVGFSGRTLDPDAKTAKYINSPETSLYHKSELLYGLSELFQEIRKAGTVIVTEGEFDVISSTQAHLNTIVAIKGSALTKQHVERLRRYVNKIILALDSDAAGVEATKRAIDVVAVAGLELRVVKLPSGKDVDELARKHPKQWREAAQAAVSVYEFFLQAALQSHSASTPEGKREIMTELAPLFNAIPFAVEQDFYIKKLATALKVREQLVREDMQRLGNQASQKKQPQREVVSSGTEPKPKNSTQAARWQLESYVLFLLFQHPAHSWSRLASSLHVEQWQLPGVAQLVTALQTTKAGDDLESLTKRLDADIQNVLLSITADPTFHQNLASSELDSEWQQLSAKLKQVATKEQIRTITVELEQLDQVTERTPEIEAKQSELLAKIVALRAKQKLS